MAEGEPSGPIVTSNHGRPNHPAILVATSDEDLVNRVASLPGAIGVVDVYSINSSVAVVKVAGKLPLEPGYLLHGNYQAFEERGFQVAPQQGSDHASQGSVS